MKKEVFNDFLEMLFAHKVKIGGQVFNFYTQDQKKIRSWIFNGTHPDFPNVQVNLTNLKVVMDEPLGIGQNFIWSHLNWELRAADPSFTNLSWLILEMEFSIINSLNVHYPLIDILLIPPIKFDYKNPIVQKDDGKFQENLIIDNEEFKKNIQIGINLSGGTLPIKKLAKSISQIQAKSEDTTTKISFDGEGRSVADIFLNYKGVCLGHSLITDGKFKNPRMLTHSKFDPELTYFEKWISGADGDPKNFEKGICNLLHFLGFQTEHF